MRGPRATASRPTPTACPGPASRAGSAPRPARRAGAPSSPPLERSGLQVGSVGLLGDVYFGATKARSAAPAVGFRATSGVLIGARSPLLSSATSNSTGLFASDRRLFGASAARCRQCGRPGLGRHATVPYIGIGYSNLWGKSGWSFSADLGVVSQSPGNVVRFGRVFGGSQSLDDVVRDMRLAPVVQLGVSYSF